MIACTGGISQSYQPLEVVFAFASTTGGPIKAYQDAFQQLCGAARKQGADGLIFVGFEHRVAVAQGCFGPTQAFEVFAWGTAVRIARA